MDLDIDCVEQEMDNWCWAACVQMTLTHFGEMARQCELATWALGGDCCDAPSTCNATIMIADSGGRADIKAVLENWDVEGDYENVPLDAQTLATRLQAGPVIALLGGSGFPDGHFVLIVGLEQSDDSNPTLLINNPKSNPPEGDPVSYKKLRFGTWRDDVGSWRQTLSTHK